MKVIVFTCLCCCSCTHVIDNCLTHKMFTSRLGTPAITVHIVHLGKTYVYIKKSLQKRVEQNMGNLCGRVGTRNTYTERIMGRLRTVIDNGESRKGFCDLNGLVVVSRTLFST